MKLKEIWLNIGEDVYVLWLPYSSKYCLSSSEWKVEAAKKFELCGAKKYINASTKEPCYQAVLYNKIVEEYNDDYALEDIFTSLKAATQEAKKRNSNSRGGV